MLKKAQAKFDEFALILLAGFILLTVFMIGFIQPVAKFEVSPSSVDLNLQRGASSVFTITINGSLFNMTLKGTGDIADWVTFSKNNFDIAKEATVDVNIRIPPNAAVRTHQGSIQLTSGATTKSIPVKITVSNVTVELISRPIALGDFSVSFPGGKEITDSKSDVEVRRGISGESKVNLIGILTEEKLSEVTGGEIQLIITESNQLGNLIVTFNGKRVYDKKPGGENLITIAIEKELIKASNVVTIEAGSPGIVFWSNTVYKLDSAILFVDSKVIPSKEFNFDLTNDEVKNFKNFRLAFRIKDYSKPIPELIIKINNQIVNIEKPPLGFFNKVFTQDILGNKILVIKSNNTISLSIEKDGFLKIADTVLVVSS